MGINHKQRGREGEQIEILIEDSVERATISITEFSP
jgi:hypothetical protein